MNAVTASRLARTAPIHRGRYQKPPSTIPIPSSLRPYTPYTSRSVPSICRRSTVCLYALLGRCDYCFFTLP
jgi:hypothetical protein